jgi:hypothetical protein
VIAGQQGTPRRIMVAAKFYFSPAGRASARSAPGVGLPVSPGGCTRIHRPRGARAAPVRVSARARITRAVAGHQKARGRLFAPADRYGSWQKISVLHRVLTRSAAKARWPFGVGPALDPSLDLALFSPRAPGPADPRKATAPRPIKDRNRPGEERQIVRPRTVDVRPSGFCRLEPLIQAIKLNNPVTSPMWRCESSCVKA